MQYITVKNKLYKVTNGKNVLCCAFYNPQCYQLARGRFCIRHKNGMDNRKKRVISQLPLFLEQWDFEKNTLNPSVLTSGSNKKVWWKCDDTDHPSYLAKPNDKIGRNTKCPYCTNKKVCITNNIQDNHIEILEEWDYNKNSENPLHIVSTSGKKVWWKCLTNDKHPSYDMIINDKIGKKLGCPYCSGHRVCLENCIKTFAPLVLKEWDYDKNILSPNGVTYQSHKKVWWKCLTDVSHPSYNMIIQNKVNGEGCPYCTGKRIYKTNSLEYLRPDIAREWDKKLNKKAPTMFTVSSGYKVWWKCLKNTKHPSWKTSIAWRTNKKAPTKCPTCNQSKGEIMIYQFLTRNNIKYIQQFSYTTHKRLKYDFMIEYNNKRALIEFDGIQHFDICYYYKTKKELNNRIETDNKKNLLSYQNDNPLLRISYTHLYEIDHILSQFLTLLDDPEYFLFLYGQEYWN